MATQTDLSAEEVACMEKRACKVSVVQENVLTRDFLESGSSKVPDVIKFYTGLPSCPRLMTVFNYLSSDLVESSALLCPSFSNF